MHVAVGARVSVPVGVYMVRDRRDARLRLADRGAAGRGWRDVFVASDSILSVNRFVRPLPQARLAIMVTYHVGQALIVAGVLAA